ncbi:hypothetical protein [Streptomyces sp. NBC_00344]|uniref:hypothetical protein n=1 Tax=Streptomyces sp. NBC_00344 TaxID=2975720 RepID=UPI002E208DCC
MIRRLTAVVAGALVAGVLAAGAASAAPAPTDNATGLTPKEQVGLHFANELVGTLLGQAPLDSGR